MAEQETPAAPPGDGARTSVEAELAAIAEIVKALTPLAPDARARAIRWVDAKFGTCAVALERVGLR